MKTGYLTPLAVGVVATMCLALVGCGEEETPIPAPLASAPVAFTTEDGVEIKGRLFGPGATGVVMAHMYPADQRSWWDFAQVLAERGYMALAFDFRGYGESSGDKKISLVDLDVEAAVDFLKELGVSDVFLVGASMGGTASLKVSAQQEVSGVVSLSAPVEFQGIDVKAERVKVPVLLIATRGDGSAKRSLELMVEEGIVGELAETIVYEAGNDHGTDILKGENSAAARERILAFLEAHRR